MKNTVITSDGILHRYWIVSSLPYGTFHPMGETYYFYAGISITKLQKIIGCYFIISTTLIGFDNTNVPSGVLPVRNAVFQ